MPDQRILLLFARKLSGEASPEELRELEAYLREHPEEQYIQEILGNWWESGHAGLSKPDAGEEERFSRIWQQTSATEEPVNDVRIYPTPVFPLRRNWPWRRWVAAAAVLAGLLLTAYYFIISEKTPTPSFASTNEIVAKKGTRSKVLLPDGTQVWLNADSRLSYKNAFGDSLREVVLEGEAYFDVVKDSRRPFIVHTSGINIRVLGTAFTVKSYPRDPTIEATLLRGLIEVEKNNQPRSSRILLKPNEKLVYNKSMNQMTSGAIAPGEKEDSTVREINKPETISISTLAVNSTDSTRAETSWIYGKLIFEGESFRQLAPQMERWFNVKILFRDEKAAAFRFTGVFESENVSDALHALQLTAPFSYTITGNEIWIDKKVK